MKQSTPSVAIVRRLGIGLATSVMSAIPNWIMRPVVFLWFKAVASQEPRRALSSLLSVDSFLGRQLDQAALRYGNGIHVKHRLTRYHDFFVDRIRPGETVLDIGCGIGAVSYSIATRCDVEVVGIDLDEGQIRQARSRYPHPRLEFVVGDATVTLPGRTFDVIVISNVLEHIEQRVAFLRSAQRSIRPKKWLLRVPMLDRHWTVPLRQELGLAHFSDETHFVEYTEESFRCELMKAGLTVSDLRVCWGEIWAEAVPSDMADPAGTGRALTKIG